MADSQTSPVEAQAQAHLPFQSLWLKVRDIRVHLRAWGPPDAPLLVMLHGWMDVAATFQFVAEKLAADWRIVAPDQRGFGLSDWPVHARGGGGQYAFIDLIADLDALLDQLAPDRAVNLVGHSMGANLACLYAGLRPERVRRVVDLEGFGLAPSEAASAPQRYRRWLDALRAGPALRPYASHAELAARLMRDNVRLSAARATFLARHWGRETAPGRIEILADPAHKIPTPLGYPLQDVMAIWREATASVLHLEARDSPTLQRLSGGQPQTFRDRFSAFRDWREVIVDDAGHMLQHDQPERVAHCIDAFCR